MIILVLGSNFKKNFIALINSSVDLNCVQELVHTQYFEKTKQEVRTANSEKL